MTTRAARHIPGHFQTPSPSPDYSVEFVPAHYQRAVRVAETILDPDDVVLAETLNFCGLALQENDMHRCTSLGVWLACSLVWQP